MNKIRQAVVAVVATLTLVGCTQASAAPIHVTATPAPQTSEQTRFNATLVCPRGLAEDSATHVRLVTFDRQPDGSVVLVYRCKRFGY